MCKVSTKDPERGSSQNEGPEQGGCCAWDQIPKTALFNALSQLKELVEGDLQIH